MALDRQKILNELGSVVKQLQSANCGCLSGLFGQGHAHNPSHGQVMPACGAACGGHHNNYNNSYGPTWTRGTCGEPCSGHVAHNNCMLNSNPHKLFSETQNYLNSSIVQPIVKDVYEELKSINPGNTIGNNPLAKQIGLPYSGEMPQSNQQGSIQNNSLPEQSYMGKMPILQNNMDNFRPQMEKNYMVNNNMNPNYVNNNDVNKTQGFMDANDKIPASTISNPLQFTTLPVQNTQMLNQGSNQTSNVNKNLIPNSGQILTPTHSSYGAHTQGMNKFKEMFPEILGNGDLGFDPMAIAIQMNPANQQTREKKLVPINASQNAYSNQLSPNAQNLNNSPMYQTEQVLHAMPGQPMIQNQGTNDKVDYIQQPSQLPSISEMSNENIINQSKTQIPPETKQILPGESYKSNTNTYEYNTLGQPVVMLPANVYHRPEPNLPQTLSPQSDYSNRLKSNVKSTVSKTSLMEIKPIGKTPSRAHLQRLYKESKLQLPQNPSYQGITQSDAKLNNRNQNYTVKYIEKTGGDTVLNNDVNKKVEADRVIDNVPPTGNPSNAKMEKLSSDTNPKSRNGLQDIVYTTYPTSTSWSFHGDSRSAFSSRIRART